MNDELRDTAEALDLADRDYILGRMRRLKRASDLTFKGKEFTDYAPTPAFEYVWKQEMRLDMYKIAKKNEEFAALNAYRK
jgi:ubiquinol-cytochrome c reductase subunit 7